MTTRHFLLGALFWPLFVQGCAPKPFELPTDAPSDVALPVPTPVHATGSGPGGPAGAVDPGREPTGVLTLQGALAATVSRNPELQSFSWAVRATDAELLQAGVRPNPELSVTPENFVGSGTFDNRTQFQNTLQLSQLIELGDKRARRSDVAVSARDKASAEYEAKRVEILGATTLDFIEVLGDQERLKLAQLAVSQGRESLTAAERRVEAGVGSRLEVTRTKILVARAEVALEHVEHELKTSRRNLAARWGARVPVFAEVQGELFDQHTVPTLEQLEARLDEAPERKLAIAEVRMRAAEVALARTKQTSDVTVSAGWRHGRSWDDQTAVAGFSIPLQLFHRYEGDIAAAEATEQAARYRSQTAETRLSAVLFGLYQELLHAQAELEVIRKEIVPQSEEALALARKGFGEGLFSQLELLDAQRTLVEVRREFIETAATFHRLVAEVERLLGEAL